jgi:F0F1-type ATP synthase membrane subunit b/b'
MTTVNKLPNGVVPILGDETLDPTQGHQALNNAGRNDEHTGPLKKIVANQDSLYKYISWEDPVRTLGSYLGALSILLGVHYLPLTQLALKAGATLLGAVTATELLHGTFTSNTLLTRLRPREYKKIPESTLNDTLRDIHDFAQYAVVKAQKILFCEEWEKTLAAFVGLTALYWLNKLVPPFGLVIIGLTSLYIAPLVNSPRGREVAHDAAVRADELRVAAVNNTQKLAQDGKAKAAELSSQAQATAQNAQRRAGELAQNGKQAAVNLTNQASDKAAYASGVAADTTKNLPRAGNNAINQAYDSVAASTGRATSSSSGPNTQSTTHSISDTAANVSNKTAETAKQYLPQSVTNAVNQSAAQASHLANTTTETARQMAPSINDSEDPTYTLERTAERLRDTPSSIPRKTVDQQLRSVSDVADSYAATGDYSASHGVMDRPRGTLPETTYQ